MASRAEKAARQPDWYKLDNSALIYPAVMRRNWAAMFRVSITLNETIDPDVLQRALEDTVRRIPTFRLSLHRGLFWYYLDLNKRMPRVTATASECGITGNGSRWSCSIPFRTVPARCAS